MIDVILTTFNRVHFLKQTVESLLLKNPEPEFRLFIIDDGSTDGTDDYLLTLSRMGRADVILSHCRRGLAFSLNAAWKLATLCDEFEAEYPYLCYLQDDVESVEEEWLLTAVRAFETLGQEHYVGFFSGCHAPEHPAEHVIQWEGRDVFLKLSNSGQNMIALKSFWRSIGYIPKTNPDGTERGMPGNGKGSNVDVYLEGCFSGSRFQRQHAAKNCSYSQGKKTLVIPGLLRHLGDHVKDSTWQTEKNKKE